MGERVGFLFHFQEVFIKPSESKTVGKANDENNWLCYNGTRKSVTQRKEEQQ